MMAHKSGTIKKLCNWLLRKSPVSAVRRVAQLNAAIASDVGIIRSENQDRVIIARNIDAYGQSRILICLSDGMGGMSDGAVCASSTLAVMIASFFEYCSNPVEPMLWLKSATEDANNYIYSQYSGAGGATLSAVLVTNYEAFWANVGDSRVYQLQKQNLVQLSVDDTVAGQLKDYIPNDSLPANNILQFIGMGKEIIPHVEPINLSLGVEMLLTSDGVHYVDRLVMNKIVNNARDVAVCAKRLIDLSKWCGGHDNSSAIFISLAPQLGGHQADMLSNESNICEVWDPYGELHIYLAGSEQDSHDVCSDRKKIISNRLTDKFEHKDQDIQGKSKPRKKRQSVSKKMKVDVVTNISEFENKKNSDDIPQLKIDFPNKEV